MDEQLKQIGERLRGLRDVLDIPVSEMAETIGIDAEKYEKIEKGELDITISNLMKIAHKYGVSTEELIFAEAPHMKSYYVTRKGQGMSIERTKAYKYQSLVGGFVNHKADVSREYAPSTRTHTRDRSSTLSWRAVWSSTSAARRWCLKRATASTSTPPSPTVCWP